MRKDVKNIEGQRFGFLVADKPTKSYNGNMNWVFKCDCGNIVERRYNHIKNRKNKPHCGCGGIKKGQSFNSFELVSFNGKTKNRRCIGVFKCRCGNIEEKALTDVKLGVSKQCKKCSLKNKIKHNKSGSPTYTTWISMKNRCGSKKGYEDVIVCESWINSFECFLKDMGERPKNKTLDRINPFGNYEPKNCKWATKKEQAENKRNKTLVLHNKEYISINEWCKKTKLKRYDFYNKKKRGELKLKIRN